MASVPAESEVTDGSQRRKEDGQGRKVRGGQEKRGEQRDLRENREPGEMKRRQKDRKLKSQREREGGGRQIFLLLPFLSSRSNLENNKRTEMK